MFALRCLHHLVITGYGSVSVGLWPSQAWCSDGQAKLGVQIDKVLDRLITNSLLSCCMPMRRTPIHVAHSWGVVHCTTSLPSAHNSEKNRST